MGYKQRNKKKGVHHDIKHSHQRIHNPRADNPQMRQLNVGRAHFEVQKQLGRPIKKFNLLYSLDDGDWFSSEDDLNEGFIKGVLNRLSREHPVNCGGWKEMYELKSRNITDDKKFFMYANLSDECSVVPSGWTAPPIDKFKYFTWSSEA